MDLFPVVLKFIVLGGTVSTTGGSTVSTTSSTSGGGTSTTSSSTKTVTLTKTTITEIKVLMAALSSSFVITKTVTVGGLVLHAGDKFVKTVTVGGSETLTIESVGDLEELMET